MTVARCRLKRLALFESADHFTTVTLARWSLSIAQQQQLRASHTSTARRRVESLYLDSSAPSVSQRLAAIKFFEKHRPQKSWVADEWRSQPYSLSALLTPEIVLLGRSNVGKSSLLNALFGSQEHCRVGSTPGKTKVMHAWNLARVPQLIKSYAETKASGQDDYTPKLTLLDMPGYGHGSYTEWGPDIMKYLTARRQLRKAFLLFNPTHGLKQSDWAMIYLLRRNKISYQLIACKCDHLKGEALSKTLLGIRNDVDEQMNRDKKQYENASLETLKDILAVGNLGDGYNNKKVVRAQMQGLDEVMWAILQAAGLDKYAESTSTPALDQSLKSDHIPQKTLKQLMQVVESLSGPKSGTPDTLQTSQSPQSHQEESTFSPLPSEQLKTPKASGNIGLSLNDFLASSTDSSDSTTSPPYAVNNTSNPAPQPSKPTRRANPFRALRPTSVTNTLPSSSDSDSDSFSQKTKLLNSDSNAKPILDSGSRSQSERSVISRPSASLPPSPLRQATITTGLDALLAATEPRRKKSSSATPVVKSVDTDKSHGRGSFTDQGQKGKRKTQRRREM